MLTPQRTRVAAVRRRELIGRVYRRIPGDLDDEDREPAAQRSLQLSGSRRRKVSGPPRPAAAHIAAFDARRRAHAQPCTIELYVCRTATSSPGGGNRFAPGAVTMSAGSRPLERHAERLWTAPD